MKNKELVERLLKLEEMVKGNNEKPCEPSEPNPSASTPLPPAPKMERTKRAPSEYNLYMRDELARLKKEQGDKFDRKEAFKTVAQSWKKKKEDKPSGGWFS